jgi:hypothetical protein
MIHFHDLRHTGNQLAADAGANLRELMDRMGHSTTRAAMAYLHGSDERQQAIADELSRQAAAALGGPNPGRSGTQRARRRGEPHEANGRPGRTYADLVFCERARQDSNPRPAA